MTIEEIFSGLAAHMVEGLMIHSKLSDYYGFLGLLGYSKCHRYHYFEENTNYRKLSDYYLSHYNKIIEDKSVQPPNVIPTTWYEHKRSDVSVQTRKTSIQAGFDRWVKWEKETKKIYEMYFKELMNLGEVASACKVKELILDVDNELAYAEQKKLELEADDYNISNIIMEQEQTERDCLKKLKELELC